MSYRNVYQAVATLRLRPLTSRNWMNEWMDLNNDSNDHNNETTRVKSQAKTHWPTDRPTDRCFYAGISPEDSTFSAWGEMGRNGGFAFTLLKLKFVNTFVYNTSQLKPCLRGVQLSYGVLNCSARGNISQCTAAHSPQENHTCIHMHVHTYIYIPP